MIPVSRIRRLLQLAGRYRKALIPVAAAAIDAGQGVLGDGVIDPAERTRIVSAVLLAVLVAATPNRQVRKKGRREGASSPLQPLSAQHDCHPRPCA